MNKQTQRFAPADSRAEKDALSVVEVTATAPSDFPNTHHWRMDGKFPSFRTEGAYNVRHPPYVPMLCTLSKLTDQQKTKLELELELELGLGWDVRATCLDLVSANTIRKRRPMNANRICLLLSLVGSAMVTIMTPEPPRDISELHSCSCNSNSRCRCALKSLRKITLVGVCVLRVCFAFAFHV